MSAFTFSGTTSAPITTVRARVESALSDEGFGILTEIDVAATLKAKLGVDRSPYVILGACNPRLAHQVLEIEPSIGALLPRLRRQLRRMSAQQLLPLREPRRRPEQVGAAPDRAPSDPAPGPAGPQELVDAARVRDLVERIRSTSGHL